MICPKCGCTTRIVDSRSVDNGQSTRRRHACIRCNRRFTTYEITERKMAEYERMWVRKIQLEDKIEKMKRSLENE